MLKEKINKRERFFQKISNERSFIIFANHDKEANRSLQQREKYHRLTDDFRRIKRIPSEKGLVGPREGVRVRVFLNRRTKLIRKSRWCINSR